MKIHFNGAAQTVTGSQHLLEINGHRLLLDCGLFQGRRKEANRRNRNFNYDPAKLDAVILSHAHIDHSGNLPHLVKHGYTGPIYATHATADLADVMLRDSGHIHESDVKYINKRRLKRGEPLLEPLYTEDDAASVKQYFHTLHYKEHFNPIPGVEAHLVDAGHILGSAAVVLDIEEAGRKFRLWFSGDIGRCNLPLIPDPVMPSEVDYLLMESTYGDKPHAEHTYAYNELRDVVAETLERDGKVIVPAFAVGRTQELVYCLHQMMDKGEVPQAPVFVDSPLAVNVTDVFRKHADSFDEETQAFIRSDKHKAALGFDLLTYTRSVEESKALNLRRDPMVIISASGMAETGRILHHLRHNVEDPRNTVLIVSWQAPHTLGRRLAEGVKQIKVYGEVYELKAQVAKIRGFSAHAGQSFLVEYALRVKDRAKQIFLVHGEPRGADGLKAKLAEHGMTNLQFPELHSTVEI